MKDKLDMIRNGVHNYFIENKGKPYKIIVAISLIVAIIAGIVTILDPSHTQTNNIYSNNYIESVTAENFNTIIEYKKTDSIVELINVTIDETERFPKLDIKLRNSGDLVAYLYKLEIDMAEYFQLNEYRNIDCLPAEPSKNYDIMLTEEKKQSFDISQKIPGNDVDRFTVSLATDTGSAYIPAICVFSFRLYFNNEEYVESGYIVIPITNPKELNGFYVSSIDYDLAYDNYINLKRINEIDAIKSESFIKILESYEENKESFSPATRIPQDF